MTRKIEVPSDGRYGERLDLRVAAPRLIREHVARYRYAARYVRGRRVLDAGTGTGYGAVTLLAEGARLVAAVDIDHDAVEAARVTLSGRGLVVRADVLALPIRDGSFDACVALETIEHVRAPHRFLAEIARSLLKDSPLVLSTPNRLSRAIPHENPHHLREFSPAELVELLAEQFRVVQWAGQYLPTGGPRDALREWIANSEFADLARRVLPRWLRSAAGRVAAGPSDVVDLPSGSVAASTIVVVAEKR